QPEAAHVVYAILHGRQLLPLCQSLRKSRTNGEQPKLFDRQQFVQRWTALLAIVDEMADQLPQRPRVQRFLIRLESDQVPPAQFKAIGRRSRQRTRTQVNDDEIEKLLFQRQVNLGLDSNIGIVEKVLPSKAEQTVKRSWFAHPWLRSSWAVPL